MPNLVAHHSMMAEVLRNDPPIYDKLRSTTTSGGVTFARCIKTGIDNPGHPILGTTGLIAGDFECFEVFRELFDPVIAQMHGQPGASPSGHPTALVAEQVSSKPMDPTGHYVCGVQLRACRNLQRLPMPSACSMDERREVERLLVLALLSLPNESKGNYFPLVGSYSYAPKPGGMQLEEEDDLQREGLLFDAPDSAVSLSNGFGRHWPDARGVFVSDGRLHVRLNDEDHLRLVVSDLGQDIQGAFGRLCRTLDALQCSLEVAGHRFAHSERLGYISSCVSRLGTCLAVTVTVKVPLLEAHADFPDLCNKLGVSARSPTREVSRAGGMVDIFSAARLGTSEVEQVNLVIRAVQVFVALEARISRGEAVSLNANPESFM